MRGSPNRSGKQTNRREKHPRSAVLCRAAIMVVALIAAVTAFKVASVMRGKSSALEAKVSPNPRPIPSSLSELLALTTLDLKEMDIGLMNFLCAEGLRGAEALNVSNYLTRLDGIAKHVESETQRHMHRFWNNRAEFNNSEGYFRMLLMAVTLQEDLRMRYNPERITAVGDFEPNEVFFADSRDVFIHGLVADDRRMGTCSSLPVLYVAIGRRLGYPLKLVPTQNHLFVRWEDGRDRFNVDATGRGMNMYDDNHYRQWPTPISHEEEQDFGYLKSMTPADELTGFLGLRGHTLFAMGKVKEGVEAHELALRLSPDSRLQQLITAKARERIQPHTAPVAYLPPELRDPYWPRPKAAPVHAQGVPGVAPAIPPDPNPINKIRNP